MKPSMFKKQPWEERQLEFDTANALATGDSLSSATVDVFLGDTSYTATMATGTSTLNNKVYSKIIGGTNGLDYIVRVRAVTANGDRIEDEITLQIRET